MPSFLSKLFASPAVRKAALSLVLAALAALGYSQFGCTLAQTEAARARVDLFECRAHALQPVVGDVLDAQELVRDVYAGKASLGAAFAALKVTQAEAEAVAAALAACDGPSVPEGDPS
jgi:hypothetical protein